MAILGITEAQTEKATVSLVRVCRIPDEVSKAVHVLVPDVAAWIEKKLHAEGFKLGVPISCEIDSDSHETIFRQEIEK